MSHRITIAIGEIVEKRGAIATTEKVTQELEAAFSPADLQEFARQLGFTNHKDAVEAILKDSGY